MTARRWGFCLSKWSVWYPADTRSNAQALVSTHIGEEPSNLFVPTATCSDQEPPMTSWKDDLSARERVTTVIETVTEPVSTNWVAEEADVHWNTAADRLEEMAEAGYLHRIERDDSTTYVPDSTKTYIEEIRQLARELSADELRAEITAAKEAIEQIQDQYDVESREELEESLVEPDVSAEETKARSHALRDWDEENDTITLLKHALRLQDDLLAVDPYAEVERQGQGRDGQRRSEVA